MKTTIALPSLAVASLLSASTGLAQQATLGFPLGEKSRIHTNLDLGVAYDSNPYRFDRRNADARSDWRGLVRPGLVVDVPGSRFRMNLASQLGINQYFGVDQEAATTFGGSVGLNLQAGGDDSTVSFGINNTVVRTPTVLDDAGTIPSDEIRFKEWYNRGRATFTLRPGGGALEFDVGYTNTMSFYDDLPWSMQHGGALEARWRFLPKTVVFLGGNLAFFSAERSDNVPRTLQAAPYRIHTGINTAITHRFSAHANVGIGDTLTWTDGHFSAVSPFNMRTVIGGAGVGYMIGHNLNLALAYDRRVSPIILLNSYRADTLSLTARLALTPRLQFGLLGKYEFRAFSGPEGRSVQVMIGDARVDYWFFDFLVAGLSYRLLGQRAAGAGDTTVAGVFLEDFARHQIFLNLGFRY